MDKKVVIMRGIPGSGKSTYVKEHFPNACTVSADYYFIQEDGSYKFDRSKLSEAHARCMKKFVDAITYGICLIIVDNTNINLVDIAPYIAVANAYNYGVEVIELHVKPVKAHERNIHGVPLKNVLSMAQRLERGSLSVFKDVKVFKVIES